MSRTSRIFTTPEDAQSAFYKALEMGDLEALMAVFAEDDEVVCVHPNGQRVAGHNAIRESWREIFQSNPGLQVQLTSLTRWIGGVMAATETMAMVSSRIDPSQLRTLLISSVFQRGARGWRLVCHHATFAAEGIKVKNDDPPARVLH